MEARTGGRRREAAWLGGLIALVGLGLWLGLGSGRKASDRGAPAVDEGAAATAEPDPEPATAAPLDTSAQRLPSEVTARPDRDLVLVLERFPDGEPVAWTPVRVESRGAGDLWAGLPNGDDWLATSGEGRVTVRVPGSARRLRIEARGYEVREVPLGFYAQERRLALTPSEGLFGRVLREDGEPAEGAEVRAVTTRWTAQVRFDSRLPKPQVHTSGLTRVTAGASANAEGFYFLACPTASPGGPVTVEARLGTSVATQEVALPRAAAALPDLVLGPPKEVLVVRVVDPQGNPIPDAFVRCVGRPLPPGKDRTDARGELALVAPALPATFFANAVGTIPRAIRFDGQEVPLGTPVESASTDVEIELEAVPGARIRLVDEESRLPVFLGHGRVVLWAGGAAIGGNEFEPDRQGEAWVSFVDAEGQEGPPAELARSPSTRTATIPSRSSSSTRARRPDRSRSSSSCARCRASPCCAVAWCAATSPCPGSRSA